METADSIMWHLQQSSLKKPHLSSQSEMKHFAVALQKEKNFSPADDNTRTVIREKKIFCEHL